MNFNLWTGKLSKCVSKTLVVASVLLLATACSSSETDDSGSADIRVPATIYQDTSVKSLSRTALTFVWDAVPSATEYGWELANEAESSVLQSGKTDQTTVVVDRLRTGQTYKFRVRTRIGNQYSPWSSYVAATTERNKTELSKPSAQLESVNEGVAVLSWSAVGNATNYAYELLAKADRKAVTMGETDQTTCTLSGLTNGATYLFRVKALPAANSDYLASAWSNEVTVNPADPTPSVDLGLPLANENDGVVRAFPGAEGGGMYTTGGRGGEIYYVTNLNDSGAGSLRDAVSKGNRTVVFAVCGTIKLQKDIEIKSANLTIAGQTAPGDGICVSGGTITVKANNVIIRYMRFRLGDLNEGGNLGDGSDTIWGRYFENIILDHCSMSWSIDEVASFYANKNFTMQWCLLAEALCNSAHGKGSHGYGGIWGGKNASFHHNMLANNNSRNARIDHPYIYGNYLTTHRGHVDYRNNVIYNWGDNSTYGGEDGWFNIVNNYYKPGPASKQRNYFVDANSYYSGKDTYCRYPRLYLAGNYHAGSYATALNSDNWQGVYYHDGTSHTESDVAGMHLTAPLSIKKDDVTTCYTSTHTAEQAFEQVLTYVGASLHRDAVDTRITGDARTGTATYATGSNGSKGGIIDSQKDVGGWPELKASAEEISRASVDKDQDGIPDYYEDLLGLDSNNAADAKSKTLDPQKLYTNFEVYLHYLVKEVTAAQVASGTYTALD